jgi:hypothetical protein
LLANNSCETELFELFAKESEVDAINTNKETVFHLATDKYDNIPIKLINILLDRGYDQNLLGEFIFLFFYF